MIDSIHISANGMQGQQALVDAISNNIANINTQSYKANRVQFGELVTQGIDRNDSASKSQTLGGGVSVASQVKDFSPGELKPTGGELDVAIVGKGFFEVVDQNGDLFYSRMGSFQVDQDGFLVSVGSLPLSSLIQIPSDTVAVKIADNGEVFTELPDRAAPMKVGQIELAHFVSPEGLKVVGEGLYQTTDKSGEAIFHSDEYQSSKLIQGFVEGSNVDMVTELTSLVLAQKAYGLNSRLLQASDEILGLINDLRR